MSLVETTAPNQTDTLSFELELPHPPAKVWRALTVPALVSEWLLPVVGFDLTKGAAFHFQASPQPGWDGRVDCEVREVEPEKSLAYAWVVGPLRTVVTFTLEAKGEGTRLAIVQAGFAADQKQNFGGARYGWKMMGEKLARVVAEKA